MKKAFWAVFFLISIKLSAQDGPLEKGQMKFNLGIGLGSYLAVTGGSTSFPPLTFSAERAINEHWTLGGLVGYAGTSWTYSDVYSDIKVKTTYTNLLIGARANYYFDVDPKFDVYAGGMLGYNVVSSSSSSNIPEANSSVSVGGILYTIHAGGRYNFSSRASLFAELGYGIAALNIGLTFQRGKK